MTGGRAARDEALDELLVGGQGGRPSVRLDVQPQHAKLGACLAEGCSCGGDLGGRAAARNAGEDVAINVRDARLVGGDHRADAGVVHRATRGVDAGNAESDRALAAR